MTTQLVTQPYHLPRDGGPALCHLGAVLRFKATSEQTAGRMWAKELTAPRGMATPVHRHTREDEAFYVLDGEVSVYVDDQVVRARTGHFLWAPREVPHAFCVESALARLLVVSTPGGFEKFFFDTGEPASVLAGWPPAGEPPDVDALVAALAEYGVTVVGPPPVPTAVQP